jgi:hypothetical protein
MAEGEELGSLVASWPKQPSEGVPTYDVLHRALMTVPHFKAFQKDAVWGGSGEAWSTTSSEEHRPRGALQALLW